MTTPQAEVPESVTYRELRELLRTFAASDWTGLTLRVGGMTITVGRHGPPASFSAGTAAPARPAAAPAASAGPGISPPVPASPVSESPAGPAGSTAAQVPPAATGAELTGCVPVRSPAVGSFWAAPQPGAPPFAQVGQDVGEGDQLAIVEVMKLMNPVLAPVAGQIAGICAANADLVEYDQVLFWLRPVGPAEQSGAGSG